MLRIGTWLSVGVVVLSMGGGVLRAQATGPSENLLPGTTKGFVAVASVDRLTEHWNKTQVGQLMADPVMEPFAKDLRRQIENRWSGVHERLGLTLDDLKDVPGGEAALALILTAPHEAALAIVVDVTGHLEQANAMLEKVAKNLAKQGGKRTVLKVAETTAPVVQFDIPEPEERREATRRPPAAGGAEPEKTPDRPVAVRKAFYCLTGNLLCATDNVDVIREILARAAGGAKGHTLADVPAFQAVMARCATDAKGAMPQVRWFANPIGYIEAVRAATPPERRRKGKTVLEIMQNQGFAGLLGVGGFLDFASEGFELVHRTAVHAPPPYEKSMKMLVFPNGPDFAPQPWVPRDIATYTTFYVDILNGFDHFGGLFDELFGQGEKGIWEDVLKSLKEDPNGPQIDLRRDLVTHLGKRVTVVSDYQLPITTTSERLLFAVETHDEKGVAQTIEKLMKNDPTVRRREIEGRVIWEMVEEETPKVPTVDVDNLPSLTPVEKPKGPKAVEQEVEEEEVRLLPHAAVTVAHGHLFVASHIDFLLKVLKPAEERETLARELDYRLVTATIEQLGIKAHCARMFSRTDEEYRPTYELIRQGKMPESETVLGRLLNALFGEGKKGQVRKQKLEGSQLPDYDVVRRSLGPAGMVITSEPDGWFFKGFTLKKGSL